MWKGECNTLIGSVVWTRTRLFRHRWQAYGYAVCRFMLYLMPHPWPTWIEVSEL